MSHGIKSTQRDTTCTELQKHTAAVSWTASVLARPVSKGAEWHMINGSTRMPASERQGNSSREHLVPRHTVDLMPPRKTVDKNFTGQWKNVAQRSPTLYPHSPHLTSGSVQLLFFFFSSFIWIPASAAKAYSWVSCRLHYILNVGNWYSYAWCFFLTYISGMNWWE